MDEFQGRVAVVTGAASGIGFALAERFAGEGMKVVLADVEDGALAAANNRLADLGYTTLPVQADVSSLEDVQSLADRAFEAFGQVDVLCNNAGVSGGSMKALWDQPMNDWRWVMGVNLWGVIHGVHAFLPRMVAQGTDGHVVNTASSAGLLMGSGIYGVTKHAVVALSESLYQELGARDAKIGVSVLCPGFVNTNITESVRNRPAGLPGDALPEEIPPEVQQRIEYLRGMLKSGYPPSEVAEAVFQGIRERKLYVVPAQDMIKAGIRRRLDNVAEERNPDVRSPLG
ncbi:MAG: SDR family NAD(P)-dependent oxidoreductase [Dehalococcoidia bacterium]